ncbi:uncharacterized protein EHS24_009322 [Apiotrichum porosum]|uniref:E3 ubiquitin-protein ligase CHFR cysteine rich domain-containing protein n=1 Tax=Apiotrichum porosum TaxID=105984 RepID=A0A427XLD3_9TREE|nr:uncharacterized protein EHS24_009322 [Apiotrichum porosum]RSH79670.1 hypothetical protein EHS24_009322 [Apiotrichum porosum]
MTRTRAQFDADTGVDPSISPRVKAARTELTTDAPTAADTMPNPTVHNDHGHDETVTASATTLALLEELECGICVQQWINSLPRYPASLLPGDPVPEPVSCPHCRHAPIQTATPSRVAKTMVTLLLERHPDYARSANEHAQAEELYAATVGGVLTFPVPPPPPRQLQRHEFWRPCRSCYPQEEGAWRCPVPVPRFDVPSERDRCLRADGVCPEGHRLCAGCDRLSPSNGPVGINCGICGEGFCGDAAFGCDCSPVSQSKPTSQFNAIAYVLEDCPSDMLAMAFKDNWTEMYHLGVYLGQNEATLKAGDIYNAILEWVRSPEGIESGGLLGLMTRADINLRLRTGMADEMQHAVMAVGEGETQAGICGGCADEIFCAGIFEWWMRELKKPEVTNGRAATMQGRPNCKHGRKCTKQDSDTHAKKFNHICDPLPADEAAQIQQDDSIPVGEPASERTEVTADNASDSGSDSDDEKEEDSRSYVDVGTQYESSPEGTIMVRYSKETIHPGWSVPTTTSSGALPMFNHPKGPSSVPSVSIANLINAAPPPPRPQSANTAGPSSSLLRASSPHASSSSAPRVSGSASSPLTGAYSWPTYCGAHTPPPLQHSFATNASSTLSSGPSGTLAKMSFPPSLMAKPPHQTAVTLGGDPNAMVAGPSSSTSGAADFDS